jgi:hypothetical protein
MHCILCSLCSSYGAGHILGMGRFGELIHINFIASTGDSAYMRSQTMERLPGRTSAQRRTKSSMNIS